MSESNGTTVVMMLEEFDEMRAQALEVQQMRDHLAEIEKAVEFFNKATVRQLLEHYRRDGP